jgi:hypothetical protein
MSNYRIRIKIYRLKIELIVSVKPKKFEFFDSSPRSQLKKTFSLELKKNSISTAKLSRLVVSITNLQTKSERCFCVLYSKPERRAESPMTRMRK